MRDPSAGRRRSLPGWPATSASPRVDRAVAASCRLVRPAGGPRGAWEALLGTSDPAVRREAVRSLGSIGDEGSLRALRRAGPRSGEPDEASSSARFRSSLHRLKVHPSTSLPGGRGRRPGDPDAHRGSASAGAAYDDRAALSSRMPTTACGIDLSERVGFSRCVRTSGLERPRQRGRRRWPCSIRPRPRASSNGLDHRLVLPASSRSKVCRLSQCVVLSDPEPGEGRRSRHGRPRGRRGSSTRAVSAGSRGLLAPWSATSTGEAGPDPCQGGTHRPGRRVRRQDPLQAAGRPSAR